jgi:aldehyde:ferredoxin oxidoreductase
MIMLSDLCDRLGLDTNEAGWVIAWVMECYEKGILTNKDTEGLEMTWGNVEATKEMLQRIAKREGCGDLLAEGCMRASKRIGGEAPNLAVYTKKGNTPRGIDHRASMWSEFLDTCVSSTGTIESGWSTSLSAAKVGFKYMSNPFSWEEVATWNASTKGAMLFEDSLVTCFFTTMGDIPMLTEMVNTATGWDLTLDEALKIGRRIANLFRAFNIRHGLGADLDAPSPRYGLTPVDGPSEGKAIMSVWDQMVRKYYQLMEWDERGKPLPETLKKLGLEEVVKDVW